MKQMYEENNHIDNEATSLGAIASMIQPNSSVLDVGCARGHLGKYLAKQRNCTMTGIEYFDAPLEIARASGAYRELFNIDLNQLADQQLPHLAGAFDYVVCADVLEHLLNPLEVILKLKYYLKPDGRLLASIPNVAHASIKASILLDEFEYTPQGLLDHTHIHFFTYKSISRFFTEAGLYIDRTRATFISFEGFYNNRAYFNLPAEQQRFITGDPHSLVCQYIIESRMSGQSADMLRRNNMAKMNFPPIPLPLNAQQYLEQMRTQKNPGQSSDAIISVKNTRY